MLLPDLTTLRLFLAVAREGSMHRAAQSENIAVSAISRRIGDFEKRIGLQLLHRRAHGVELTSAGRVFADHGAKILLQAKDLTINLESFREGVAGDVHLSATPAAFGGALADILRTFADRHPDVQLILEERFSNTAIAAVRDGTADLAITADTVDTQDLAVDAFAADPLWVVTPKGHPLLAGGREGEAVAFADACQYPMMTLHEGGPVYSLIMRAIEEAGGRQPLPFNLVRTRTLRRMIERGFGIGFMRLSAVRAYLGIYEIEGAPLLDDWAQQQLIIVHRGPDHLAPPATLLLEILKEHIATAG